MNLLWTEEAWEDYLYWQNDLATLQKINALIKDTKSNPFTGLGKPEPLRENLKGWWSRRITGEHRFIYRVIGKDDDKKIEIIQCQYHY